MTNIPTTETVQEALIEIRKEYRRDHLREEEIDTNPFSLFTSWLTEAIEAGLHEPNAMTLATADTRGRPSARMVLLKGFDEQGFCFYTNYESRKGRELAENPWASLVFWWGRLERQIRIDGQVEKVSAEESDLYYASRPVGSRLGAWISAQSRVIPNRDVLEARLQQLQTEFAATEPPRPPYWGGYRLIPTAIEFWQGGPHRLHDRLLYTHTQHNTWTIERLSP
jgi:pyridoxamine 5'-phosphate oxidase